MSRVVGSMTLLLGVLREGLRFACVARERNEGVRSDDQSKGGKGTRKKKQGALRDDHGQSLKR